MVEREGPEPPITGPKITDLDCKAQSLGDGIQRDQLHPPELGLEIFVEKLRSNKDQLLDRVHRFLRKPNNTPDELALGMYLDIVLKCEFDVDPFCSKHPGDEEIQADRETIAFMAGEWVGQQWLAKHPESQAAKAVARYSIYALRTDHQSLLQEMWPSLCRDNKSDF